MMLIKPLQLFQQSHGLPIVLVLDAQQVFNRLSYLDGQEPQLAQAKLPLLPYILAHGDKPLFA